MPRHGSVVVRLEKVVGGQLGRDPPRKRQQPLLLHPDHLLEQEIERILVHGRAIQESAEKEKAPVREPFQARCAPSYIFFLVSVVVVDFVSVVVVVPAGGAIELVVSVVVIVVPVAAIPVVIVAVVAVSSTTAGASVEVVAVVVVSSFF